MVMKPPDEYWHNERRPDHLVRFRDIAVNDWFIRGGKTDMIYQKTTAGAGVLGAQGYSVGKDGTLAADDFYRFGLNIAAPAEFELVTVKVTITKI